MRIVSLDPGVTTGIAVYEDPFGVGTWECWQYGPKDHHRALWSYLQKTLPAAVICESFVQQRRDKVILKSVEYIGVARLFCQETDTPLFLQTPSMAKNLWTDAKIRKLRLWVPNRPHAMDAVRHLLYYLTVTVKDTTWVEMLKS